MKKFISVILCGVLTTALLAGCGTGSKKRQRRIQMHRLPVLMGGGDK